MSNTESYTDSTSYVPEEGIICKCCDGCGVQTRYDGVRIRCPECSGTGKWSISWVTTTTCCNNGGKDE